MTRKHFETIASALKHARRIPGAPQNQALDEVAYELATEFAAFNPNFDRNRFLAACGVQS